MVKLRLWPPLLDRIASCKTLSVSPDLRPIKFRPLTLEISDDGGPFKYMLDYGTVRYHLLRFNETFEECVENNCLRRVYTALKRYDHSKEGRDIIAAETSGCLQLFWPSLKVDYEKRHLEDDMKSGDGREKPIIRIQAKTVNGTLQLTQVAAYPPSKSVTNPVPSLQLFARSEVEVLAETFPHVFKVRIRGAEYCLKTIDRKTDRHFLQEVTTLQQIPSHQNLIRLFGLIEAGEGKIDGMVLTYISGTSLRCLESATASQKNKWKKQISEAVRFLHSLDIVWGDAKPDNILIDKKHDRPILIDFGGGKTTRWIDRELVGTKEGDSQAVGRICNFIDSIGTKATLEGWRGLRELPF